MSLKQWLNNGWLRSHKTSPQEISNLYTLPLILGSERKNDVDYLDSCRKKRNIVEYDYIGGVTTDNALELIEFVKELKDDVEAWLTREHPELISSQ